MHDPEMLDHLMQRIREAKVYTFPFPFFYVKNVFPSDYYAKMLDCWPPEEAFTDIADAGRINRVGYAPNSRMIIQSHQLSSLGGSNNEVACFWRSFAASVYGRTFTDFLYEQFKSYILRLRKDLPAMYRLTAEGQLVQDGTNYGIGPHTDAPRRLINTLFYCPNDNSRRHLGTSIFVPTSEAIPCEVSPRHYNFEDFQTFATAAYAPNTMFGFVVSPNSFHGVKPIKDLNPMRRSILNYVKAKPWSNRPRS